MSVFCRVLLNSPLLRRKKQTLDTSEEELISNQQDDSNSSVLLHQQQQRSSEGSYQNLETFQKQQLRQKVRMAPATSVNQISGLNLEYRYGFTKRSVQTNVVGRFAGQWELHVHELQ